MSDNPWIILIVQYIWIFIIHVDSYVFYLRFLGIAKVGLIDILEVVFKIDCMGDV